MRVPLDRNVLPWLGGAGIGATIMFFLDPDRGARRRSLVRDRFVHAGHSLGEGVGTTSRDVRNRARGAAAVTRRRLAHEEADDRVVAERVRAELGRLVSYPGAIEVDVNEGTVTLHGPVLAREAGRLIAGVRGVRGVADVEDHIDRHETAENVPGLQGIPHTPGASFELMQENWTPAARLLTGVAGSALALYELAGERRHDPLHASLGVGGIALAARGATNRPLHRLFRARPNGVAQPHA
jgi:hypothetical protein